jgi:hypothetical protein
VAAVVWKAGGGIGTLDGVLLREEELLGMAEEAKERPDSEWRGSPLQMAEGLDPYGIEEIIIEFDTGDEEVLKPKLREEFGSYELQQAATYLDSLSRRLG